MSIRTVSFHTSLFLGFLLLLSAGCDQSRNHDRDGLAAPTIGEGPSVGDMHNEFLELVTSLERNPLVKASGNDPLVVAANTMAQRYGHAPFLLEEVHDAVARGREMAQQDPDLLVRQLLSDEEFQWWSRFALEATPTTARGVLMEHSRRYGPPPAGSQLERLVDLSISSAEYWYARHRNDTPIYDNPYIVHREKGWRDRLRKWGRFAVAVTVDGVSGVAATSGGGPVAGAVVGGLASYGADCLVFGCD